MLALEQDTTNRTRYRLLFSNFSETRFNATMPSTLDAQFQNYMLDIAREADHALAFDVNVLKSHAVVKHAT